MNQQPFLTFTYVTLDKARATLAIQVSNNKVKVGVAFCSPKDQFSKRLGRKIATGRLESDVLSYSFEHDKDLGLKAQAEQVFLQKCSERFENNVPRYFTKKAKKALKNVS